MLPKERRAAALLDDRGLLRLKGALERLIETAGIGARVRFEPAECEFFASGRSGRAMLEDRQLAVIGEVTGAVAEKYDLPAAPALAELDFDLLVEAAQMAHAFERLPSHPAAVRDLAMVVDEALPWARIEETVTGLDLAILERITFFDVFRGRQIPKGRKSVAFSLVFRAPDRTLTSDEIEAARQRCIEALASIGAELRR